MTSRRRLLLAASGAAGGLLGAGGAAAFPSRHPSIGADPFTLGVASGYPTPDSIVLWTRLAPEQARDQFALMADAPRVDWEIATDEVMRHVVSRGTLSAMPGAGHSVHVEVAGLAPARWYWYRFSALGHRSRIGRTRTLPDERSRPARLRLAVASCQNVEHGYFTAYRHLVADQPDLIVHAGDYIYEASWGNLIRQFRRPEAHTLAQYRERYTLCKLEADLQDAHALFPWVMVWDDHEVSNDYADASPGRITAPEDFLPRRAAAYRAWYENMPVPSRMAPAADGSLRIHTTLRVGELASLYLLDTRQYRSPQACPPPGRAGATTVIAADCAALQDPARTMLGGRQERWLDGEFARSATRWNLIVQPTLLAPLARPGSSGAPLRVSTDAWDGYPVSRQRLLDSMSHHGLSNTVVAGGDLHAFFVADLHRVPGRDGPVFASEFVGTSITSQAADQRYFDRLDRANEHIRYANGTQRGYLRLTMLKDRLDADLMGLADVTRPDSAIARQAAFVVAAGRPGAQRV